MKTCLPTTATNPVAPLPKKCFIERVIFGNHFHSEARRCQHGWWKGKISWCFFTGTAGTCHASNGKFAVTQMKGSSVRVADIKKAGRAMPTLSAGVCFHPGWHTFLANIHFVHICVEMRRIFFASVMLVFHWAYVKPLIPIMMFFFFCKSILNRNRRPQVKGELYWLSFYNVKSPCGEGQFILRKWGRTQNFCDRSWVLFKLNVW